MEENRDFLSYLQEQAGQGVKESEGEFSISLEAARSKLARFTLPRADAWVLKLIQAAVGWRMSRVEISQFWRETRFFLPAPSPCELPSEKEVLAALLSGQVLSESPLAHFCLALRAVVEQSGLSFLLVVNRGEGITQPLYAGRYFGRLSEQNRLTRGQRSEVGLTLLVRHKFNTSGDTPLSQFVGLQPTGISLLQELRDYAYMCPVPIWINGQPMGGIFESSHFRFEWQGPMALSGLKQLKHSPDHLELPLSFEKKQLSFQTSRERATRHYTGDREFACVYSLSALNRSSLPGTQSGLSFMNWVRDGIIVQTTSLPFETRFLGIQVYANAVGLQSDLTGFQLVQREAFLQRLHEIYERLAVDLLGWLDSLDDFFAEDRDEFSEADDRRARMAALRKKGPKVAGVALLGVFFSAAFPVVFIPATVAGVGSILLGKSEAQKVVLQKQKIIEAFAEDLENLSLGFKELARETAIFDGGR
ncbi:MAG: hypothetical protein WC314_20125 [Vulcanimicrobiota bacterium]